jgi:hypothetical protein
MNVTAKATDKIGKCRYIVESSAGSSLITMLGYGQKQQHRYGHFWRLQSSGFPDQRDNDNIRTLLVTMEQSMARMARMMTSFGANALSGIPKVQAPSAPAITTRTKPARRNPLAELMKKV